MKYGIHWFRRDLRVAGNPALQHQFQKFNGNVIGLFCFDHKFLARKDFSSNRFQFFLETLASLKKELRELGSDLLVLDTGPQETFPMLLKELKKDERALPSLVSWCKDYEPFARKRDQEVLKILDQHDIDSIDFRDHLVIEPNELSKPDGTPYKVFTPFARKWLEIFKSDEVQKRILIQNSAKKYINQLKKQQVEKIFQLSWNKVLGKELKLEDKLNTYIAKNKELVDIAIPEVGFINAYNRLTQFKKDLSSYHEKRDVPALSATSKLAHFLKNGSLSTSQIIHALELRPFKKKNNGQDNYFNELIWREFYYHILFHFPHVEKKSFNPKYEDINWSNKKSWFQKWKDGKTGFPIVDAGMRELKTTGFMHNRVRMIVASFLVKDLQIDWRWGERYFMEKLLDGDLAANNGGWQWCASTGCDAQPYFRIFNPWSQSKKFDPDASYIKKFVPELKDLDAKSIHQPILSHETYPAPMVEHSVQREITLDLYK